MARGDLDSHRRCVVVDLHVDAGLDRELVDIRAGPADDGAAVLWHDEEAEVEHVGVLRVCIGVVWWEWCSDRIHSRSFCCRRHRTMAGILSRSEHANLFCVQNEQNETIKFWRNL